MSSWSCPVRRRPTTITAPAAAPRRTTATATGAIATRTKEEVLRGGERALEDAPRVPRPPFYILFRAGKVPRPCRTSHDRHPRRSTVGASGAIASTWYRRRRPIDEHRRSMSLGLRRDAIVSGIGQHRRATPRRVCHAVMRERAERIPYASG
jgi:hypothetical protein